MCLLPSRGKGLKTISALSPVKALHAGESVVAIQHSHGIVLFFFPSFLQENHVHTPRSVDLKLNRSASHMLSFSPRFCLDKYF